MGCKWLFLKNSFTDEMKRTAYIWKIDSFPKTTTLSNVTIKHQPVTLPAPSPNVGQTVLLWCPLLSSAASISNRFIWYSWWLGVRLQTAGRCSYLGSGRLQDVSMQASISPGCPLGCHNISNKHWKPVSMKVCSCEKTPPYENDAPSNDATSRLFMLLY